MEDVFLCEYNVRCCSNFLFKTDFGCVTDCVRHSAFHPLTCVSLLSCQAPTATTLFPKVQAVRCAGTKAPCELQKHPCKEQKNRTICIFQFCETVLSYKTVVLPQNRGKEQWIAVLMGEKYEHIQTPLAEEQLKPEWNRTRGMVHSKSTETSRRNRLKLK